MNIKGCSGYVVVCEKGNFFNLLKPHPYGSGNQRKPLIEKRKHWLQCWNIITFFLQKHYQQKRLKNKNWDNFYIDVHSDTLGKMFGNPWKGKGAFKDILPELGILEKTTYKVGGFPKGYRLNKDLIHSEHFILEDLTEDNLNRGYKSRVTLDTEFILSNFEKIVEQRAENQRKKTGRSKKWSPFDKIMIIKQVKEFNYHDNAVVGSTGREFNKANNIPSELRKHIHIDGEATTEIDIKSSLPSILYKYTKDGEKQRYGNLITQGNLYEFFAEKMGYKGDRDLAKKAFTHYLGGKRVSYCSELGHVLHKHFPNLHQWMEGIEKEHKRKHPKGKKGEVSRLLQHIESKIIVTMLESIKKDNIFTISIHDGVRVKTYHADLVTEAIKKTFSLLVGIKPALTVEEYTTKDNRDELDQIFDEAIVNTEMLQWNVNGIDDV